MKCNAIEQDEVRERFISVVCYDGWDGAAAMLA